MARANTYSKKQIIEDIDFVVKTLKRNHPNLYKHRKPKEFDDVVKEVRSRTTAKEDYDNALLKIQEILAATCDEHTRIRTSSFINKDGGDSKNRRWMKREYFRDNFIATNTHVYMDNPAITFNRQTLMSVGDTPPGDIRTHLERVKSADSCPNNGIIFTRFGSYLDIKMLSTFLEIDENYKIEFKSNKDTTARNISQTSRTLSDVSSLPKYPSAHQGSTKLLAKYDIPFVEAHFDNPRLSKNKGIVVKSNPDKSVYYIYSYSFLHGKEQMTRTNKLLRELIRNKPKEVILDLTDNHGGQLEVSAHMLSYFLTKSHRFGSHVRMRNPRSKMPASYTFISNKMKKSYERKARQFRRTKKRNGQYTLRILKKSFGNPSYKGNLTVLISPRTHSAGTIVASVLKRKRNAKLIGYVNAGSLKTSCFAPHGHYTLPNTRIAVWIPDTCYDRPKNKNQKGKTLKPDIVVDPLGSSSNYLNTRILKAALEEIPLSIRKEKTQVLSRDSKTSNEVIKVKRKQKAQLISDESKASGGASLLIKKRMTRSISKGVKSSSGSSNPKNDTLGK